MILRFSQENNFEFLRGHSVKSTSSSPLESELDVSTSMSVMWGGGCGSAPTCCRSVWYSWASGLRPAGRLQPAADACWDISTVCGSSGYSSSFVGCLMDYHHESFHGFHTFYRPIDELINRLIDPQVVIALAALVLSVSRWRSLIGSVVFQLQIWTVLKMKVPLQARVLFVGSLKHAHVCTCGPVGRQLPAPLVGTRCSSFWLLSFLMRNAEENEEQLGFKALTLGEPAASRSRLPQLCRVFTCSSHLGAGGAPTCLERLGGGTGVCMSAARTDA